MEALCALSRMLPVGTRVPDKENRRLSDHQDNNATADPHSEGEFSQLLSSGDICSLWLIFVAWNKIK